MGETLTEQRLSLIHIYGCSRDDAAKFLNEYYTKNIFESDPFAHIDEKDVYKRQNEIK